MLDTGKTPKKIPRFRIAYPVSLKLLFLRMLRFSLTLLIVSIHISAISQSNSLEIADTDFNAFYKYLSDSLRFPTDARATGKSGQVLVQFYVDEQGVIVDSSVKVMKGVWPSLDEEAIRVIQSYPGLLRSIDKRKAWQPMVIPIAFEFNDGKNEWPEHFLKKKHFRTVIIPKPVHGQGEWEVFRYRELLEVVGKISPGDTVLVTGWSKAGGYRIENDEHSGFVSYLALKPSKMIDSLNSLIENGLNLSNIVAEPRVQVDVHVDTVRNFSSDHMFLTLSSNKKTMYEGDCSIVELNLNINFNNQVYVQFPPNLGTQVDHLYKTSFECETCFTIDSGLDSVKGVVRKKGAEEFMVYTIARAGFCPSKARNFTLTPATIYLQQVDKSKQHINTLELKSPELAIQVKPHPADIHATQGYDYKMTGNFLLKESLPDAAITGQVVKYKIIIDGEGLLLPMSPTTPVIEGVKIFLSDIDYGEVVGNTELYSVRVFTYDLVFLKPGKYDFANLVRLKYFDPLQQKVKTLSTTSKIDVSGKPNINSPLPQDILQKYSNYILWDLSLSMELTDYTPSRFEAVKAGLSDFLAKQSQCNVGLIVFGKTARPFYLTMGDSCFSIDDFDLLSPGIIGTGAAIGDAILLAKNALSKNTFPRKVVLISDGENNAGTLSFSQAARLAKENNIKIFTIGIGKADPIPLVDKNEEEKIVDSHFYDKDLKSIAQITGGKYYWAKDADEIAKILDIIFSDPKK
jgi:TonB family protein